MSISDAALEKDPAVAKAIALDYITLDDRKSGSAISQVVQRHADLVFAGLPVRGPEVQAAMDKINAEGVLISTAQARVGGSDPRVGSRGTARRARARPCPVPLPADCAAAGRAVPSTAKTRSAATAAPRPLRDA